MSAARVEGTVEIRKTLNGVPSKLLMSRKNLIVNIGFDAIVACLAGAKGQPTVDGDTYQPLDPNNPPSSDMVHDLFVTNLQVTEKSNPSVPQASDSSLEGSPTIDLTGNDLTTTYPGIGQVEFSGGINETEQNGKTFTEEGLVSRDGTLIARSLIRKPATGTVSFLGGIQPVDGEIIMVHDGTQGIIFEFDDDNTVSGSNTLVSIGATVFDTRDNLNSVINSSGLNISATRKDSPISVQSTLENTVAGEQGNQQLQTTGANVFVAGMNFGADPITKESTFGLHFTHRIIIR